MKQVFLTFKEPSHWYVYMPEAPLARVKMHGHVNSICPHVILSNWYPQQDWQYPAHQRQRALAWSQAGREKLCVSGLQSSHRLPSARPLLPRRTLLIWHLSLGPLPEKPESMLLVRGPYATDFNFKESSKPLKSVRWDAYWKKKKKNRRVCSVLWLPEFFPTL